MKVRDVETGEVHLVAFPKRRRNQGGFVMVWQEALRAAASPGLTPTEFQVLVQLLVECQFENWVELYITDLAKAVKRDRGQVGQALKELERLHYLRTVEGRRGRKKLYQLNPEFAFMGRPTQREEARRQWKEAVSQR